jgi:sialic acid synthase SpsE
MKAVQIGERWIGENQPSYIIAEVGSNHNGEKGKALESISAVAETGADAVKFQTFKADKHYSKFTPGFNYLDNTDTYELIKKLELDRSWQRELMDHSNKLGIEFLSSPCDNDAVDGLALLKTAAYKVASFDITDSRLLEYISAKQKPVILSCGMASLTDIELAIKVVKPKAGNPILLQCTSLYPAPASLSNLNAMNTLKTAFDCIVGYSDHTLGWHIPVAAVALGAKVVEKHFTLSKKMLGPDHAFAVEPHEFSEMVKYIRDVECSLGDGIKNGPRSEELEMFEKGRRSLHAAEDIPCGSFFTHKNVTIKRPGLGLPVHLLDWIIGQKAKCDIVSDQWLTKDML